MDNDLVRTKEHIHRVQVRLRGDGGLREIFPGRYSSDDEEKDFS